MIDIDYLKQLLDIFDESTVNDLRIDKEGASIRLTKNPKKEKEGTEHAAYHYVTTHPAQVPAPSAPPPTDQAAAPASAEQAQAASATAPVEASEAAPAGHRIYSPIIGTFYRAPGPDSPPYVEVGSRVQKGSVLCIIEAMKLMNEIESDVEGTVVKILAENAQAVEYGQPLFVIQE